MPLSERASQKERKDREGEIEEEEELLFVIEQERGLFEAGVVDEGVHESMLLLLLVLREVERNNETKEVGEVVDEGYLSERDIEVGEEGEEVGGETTAIDELEEGHQLHRVD